MFVVLAVIGKAVYASTKIKLVITTISHIANIYLARFTMAQQYEYVI